MWSGPRWPRHSSWQVSLSRPPLPPLTHSWCVVGPMAQYKGWAPLGVSEAWPRKYGTSDSCGHSSSFSGPYPATRIILQGLSIPFAFVGSGDPVRVLRLYTTNTLDTLWSIYCWGICTTCCYRLYCAMLKPYALRLLTATATVARLWANANNDPSHCTVRCLISACVDASRTVFWDHSVLIWPGKALILVAKLLGWF